MNIDNNIITIISGFISGIMAGMFGIGGGLITTPAIRLLLFQPANIAIGTPLPVMIPSALVGAFNYNRKRFVDWGIVKSLYLPGLIGIISGSFFTKLINPVIVMILTAIIIGTVSLNFLFPSKVQKNKVFSAKNYKVWHIGLVCGLFSGFLGLGGGILLVPAIVNIFKKDLKTAFGTSLALVSVFTIPGTIAHSILGNIDNKIAVLLALGVVPGAYIGSKLAIRASIQRLSFMFGLFLLVLAGYFIFFEISNVV